MDYTKSFSDYYKENFIDKVKTEIKKSLEPYHLNEEQMNKINSLNCDFKIDWDPHGLA